tara:strand:+ start:5364 stop:5864 length:501 start_codon:yes stop_codon:yes gene_type:complete
MAEKDVIIKEKMKYSGFGNFKEIYQYAHDWLKGEEFQIAEDKYDEKVTGDSKDLEIVWKVSKKLTDYFKMELKIKFKVIGMTDVEVQIDGKKKKMNEFRFFEVHLSGILVKDYQSQWKTPSFRFLKELYDKFIIPKRTETMEEKVEKITIDFKDEIKAILELTGKR